MNMLFLGGSNTRKSDGYVSAIFADAAAKARVTCISLSLGISGNLMGIEQFLRFSDPMTPDVVFIEYSINDVAVLAKEATALFEQGFEGLLRLIANRYPGVPILALHLKSNLSVHQIPSERILAFLRKLEAHYDIFQVVDAASSIAQEIPPEFRYADDMHYASATFPVIARLALAAQEDRPQRPAAALPAPLTRQPFELATLFKAEDLTGGEISTYRNALLEDSTHILRPGQEVALTIPGAVASISFVSTQQSGILELQDIWGSHFVSTLHRDTASGRYASLMMSIPTHWHDWNADIPQSQSVRLRCHAVRQEPFRSFFSMVEPQDGDVHIQLRSIVVIRSPSSDSLQHDESST